MRITKTLVALILVIACFWVTTWCQQQMTSFERKRAKSMLQEIDSDVRKHYYDPKFHGLDWDEKVRETQQAIDKADSANQALLDIAALLDSLNDSHTHFVPPRPQLGHEYGWQAQLVGDRCYVIRVRPGSDAEAKGVKPGDEILGINGYAPTRKTFAKITYFFEVLRPQPSLRLVLSDPAGTKRTIDVAAQIIERYAALENHFAGGLDIRAKIRDMDLVRASAPRVVEMDNELMILKFPHFFLNESKIDSLISNARKHKTLILDLRGNGGGEISTLELLLAGVFDKEIKIADRLGRVEREPLLARKRGRCFDGKVLVLVDSRSASASELFARVIQIEKRGIVLGDRTAGMVMEAQFYGYGFGVGFGTPYGAEITEANLMMTDGRSLEQVGVVPDEVVLPTSADIEAARDPVLARAAEMAGVKLSPESAAKLFPYEWPPL
jgi:C-terminal processing protease CtpA/Prc